jgi:hypothetical protein
MVKFEVKFDFPLIASTFRPGTEVKFGKGKEPVKRSD